MDELTVAAGAVTAALDSGDKISMGGAAVDAVLGYAVVFLGLILLMIVVMIVGKIFAASKKAQPAEAPAPAAAEVPEAPGTAGRLKLHDVEPKTAAMIMAIVADKMGKPLNELRFISIREVK